MPRVLRSAWLVLALAPGLLVARPAAAQFVVGHVTDAASKQPLEGAFVQLLPDTGLANPTRATQGAGAHALAAVLTDGVGSFSLAVPEPGRYRLRIARIGYGTRTIGPVVVAAGTSVNRDIGLRAEALTLPALHVTARRRCVSVLKPAEGEAVDRLWLEARKALVVEAWTEREMGLRFRSVVYARRLDTDGRVILGQTRSTRRDTGRPPFSSLSTDSLLKNGFIQPTGGGRYAFYGPDPSVILSSGFLRAHCFRATSSPAADSAGVVGLAFEPSLRTGYRRDVSGTLWLSRTTARLDSLSFQFTNLPWDVPMRATGSMAFQRLWTGVWIIRDWQIRTPMVTHWPVSGLTGPQPSFALTGVREDGGRVEAVTDAQGNRLTLSRPAALAGVVRDTATGAPLAGAHVYLLGVGDTAVTDSAGRFLLTDLLPGRYIVTFSQPALDVLGWRAPAAGVRLAGGNTDTLTLAAPSPAARRALGVADVAGRVVDVATGKPVADATVRLSGVEGTQVTDSAGGFRFGDVAPGSYTLTVRHIAYGTTTDTLVLRPGSRVSVRFNVQRGVIGLTPLVVTGRATDLARYLGGFYERKMLGVGGIFLTPSYVDRHRGDRLTDLLRGTPGVMVETSGTGARGYVVMGRQQRAGGSPCFPLLYVDGHPFDYTAAMGANAAAASNGTATGSPFGSDANMNVVPPSDIAAIEVYEGAAFIPPQFMDAGSDCGVVVVWTRRGQAAPPAGR